MRFLTYAAVAVPLIALGAAACSPSEEERAADCAEIMAALRTPIDLRQSDATWGPMWERAAARMRTARSQIKSEDLAAQADAVIKAFEKQAKGTAADKDGTYPPLGDDYYDAERKITRICGPLHPPPSA
ncbi:hypothetical protein [Actinomadura sp. 9N215]|uniref:hypothetical protein n=1 Tax=Actinomadura sp. 9N215 TaxID=3375150 RepID=UPI00378FBE51